ncbi:MAG: hypothetical protein LBC41_06920 [Clostridiales bacterium]|jgi:hypothetical protein|nr:hypothetical protein [Clostridiales bacterium]
MAKKLLAVVMAVLALSAQAYAAPTYKEAITPNKLTIEWLGDTAPASDLDAFRIRGYNVAQLRPLVEACGGTVKGLADGTYQIVKEKGISEYYPVKFAANTEVKTQYNVTSIRDAAGKLTSPTEPGWIYLVDYQYNWGSLRDILGSLGLVIDSVEDDPTGGKTKVVIKEKGATPTPTPKASATPKATPTPKVTATKAPTHTPTPTPTPKVALYRYDLRSKPADIVAKEMEELLVTVQTAINANGRLVIYGVAKGNLELNHDPLVWSGVAAGKEFASGATVPVDSLVEYAYIGTAPTPTPTTQWFDLGYKTLEQGLPDIMNRFTSVGQKTDHYGIPIVYGIASTNVILAYDARFWLITSGNPMDTVNTGSTVEKGAYVEFSFIGPRNTPTPTPSLSPTPTLTPTAAPSPTGAPTIAMIQQYYLNGNVIEVPKIMVTAPVPDLLNKKILDFAGSYQAYLNTYPSDQNKLELKLYPIQSQGVISLVMTRLAVPDNATQGEIGSVNFDYTKNIEITLADAVKESGLDLVSAESKLLNVLPGGIANHQMDSFRPAAFAKTSLGNIFFYQVTFKPDATGAIKRSIYIRFPDGSYEAYDKTELWLYPVRNELKYMDPPLFFETHS